MLKMYILIRKDLDNQYFGTSYKFVQGMHVAAEYVKLFPDTEWDNGYMICLGVKDLLELEELGLKCWAEGHPFASFNEPDIGDRLMGYTKIADKWTTIACVVDDEESPFKGLKLLYG